MTANQKPITKDTMREELEAIQAKIEQMKVMDLRGGKIITDSRDYPMHDFQRDMKSGLGGISDCLSDLFVTLELEGY